MSTAAIIDRPAPSAPLLVETLERELKFVLPASRAEFAARLLQTLSKPDAQYPDADVWTVYYDSLGLTSLYEKLNSDYLKTKIRLRWYAPPGGAGQGPVFLEAKRRVGNRRDKIRVLMPTAAETLAGRRLEDPAFRLAAASLAAKGILLGPGWEPMLALRYRRRRFVDVSSGTRVSLDSDITAVAVNHRYLFARSLGPLRVAVVEVKGLTDVLPGVLRPLLPVGLRKESMSKYAALLLELRRALH